MPTVTQGAARLAGLMALAIASPMTTRQIEDRLAYEENMLRLERSYAAAELLEHISTEEDVNWLRDGF